MKESHFRRMKFCLCGHPKGTHKKGVGCAGMNCIQIEFLSQAGCHCKAFRDANAGRDHIHKELITK